MFLMAGWRVGQSISIVVHDEVAPIDTRFYTFIDTTLPNNNVSQEVEDIRQLVGYLKVANLVQGGTVLSQNIVEGLGQAVSLALGNTRNKDKGNSGNNP